MTQGRAVATARLAAALAAAVAAAGCTEHPYLSAGDAKSADVGFGRDLAAATAVAQEHCARYEKVARYLDNSENIAYFACERR
jgi:hypothetical protein